MKPPRQSVVDTPVLQEVEQTRTTTLALAGAPGVSAEARKPQSAF